MENNEEIKPEKHPTRDPVVTPPEMRGAIKQHLDTHSISDVDQDDNSLHHTLGKGKNQAAAGNHTHDDLPPLGVIQMMVGSTVAPTGYAICDGSAVKQRLAPKLYKFWGAARYGADGVDGSGDATFKLPDLRGRQFIGAGTFAAVDANEGSAEAARTVRHTHAVGTLATANEGAHTHPAGSLASATATNTTVTGAGGRSIAPITGSTGQGTNHNHNITGSTGLSLAGDIPYWGGHYIVKLV